MESVILLFEVQNPLRWNRKSNNWDPESKTVMDYLIWGDTKLGTNFMLKYLPWLLIDLFHGLNILLSTLKFARPASYWVAYSFKVKACE